MISIKAEYDDYMLSLDAKTIRKSFKDVVVDEGKEVKALYAHLMANFTPKNRSRILRKSGSGRSPVSGAPGSIYVAVGTNRVDGPLVWLEDGTRIRYRVLSPNWRSKTRPGGGISTKPGKGKALGFDPIGFSGIEPRNFRDDIVKRRYPKFVASADAAFVGMFRKARWI